MKGTLSLIFVTLTLVGNWAHAQSTQTTVSTDEPKTPEVRVAADTLTLRVGETIVGEIRESHPLVEVEVRCDCDYGKVRGQTYRMFLSEAGTYHVDLRSYFFDAYLVLRDASGTVVAEDDDGLLNSHSRIVFDSKRRRETYFIAACALHGDVGESKIRLARGTPEELTGEARREAELADAQRELEVVKHAKGDRHPAYARSLHNLARLYYSRGEYEKALPLRLETLEINKEILGEQHPDYARDLNNLATLHYNLGAYEKAEPLFLEALKIDKETLGEHDLEYATDLNNLAILYKMMGAYEKAEPLYLEALEIRKAALGKRHPSYATSLHTLAKLYWSMGAYEKAEPLYLEALEIRKAALDEQRTQSDRLTAPRNYAASLIDLGFLYSFMGAYAKAESLVLEGVKIRRAALGEQHPTNAASLHQLAGLYYRMGAYEKAESLFLEALAIKRTALGEQHPGYATSLHNLALVYRSMGAYEKAERLFLKAQEIYKEALGERHPFYAVSLHSLAVLYKTMGAYERAMPLFQKAIGMTETSLERASTALTEERQIAMAASRRGVVHDYLDTATHVAGAAPAAFAAELAWKGAILVRQRNYRRVADEMEIHPLFERLQQVSRRLTSAYRSDPEADQMEAWKENLTDLEAEKERLVRELASQSAAFQVAQQRITVEQLIDALADDAVLVDYAVLDLERGSAKAHSKLVAFVIQKNASVTLHDLGELDPIEANIDAWRAAGYSPSSEARRELRTALWEPLLPRIGAADLVLVSPDGVLGQIPLPALPGREPGTYMLEDHRIALLPVPQLLPSLMSVGHHTEPQTGLLAVGGVDYEAEPSPTGAVPKKSLRRHPNVDPRLRGGTFSNAIQANTLAEIALIEKLFASNFQEPIVTLEDAGATEERFRTTAPGSYYIHLATHGFFAPPGVGAPAEDQVSGLEGGGSQPAPLISPYLLSGLAFAGANQPPQPDADDGILTAEEVAFLPLESAELVCLSACETGLGKVAGGEGLLGLQRAFQISGARSTIASLWKVPDLATRILMERFYLNLWEHDMSKLDALREAQLWLLENPAEARGITGLSTATTAEAVNDGRTSPHLWAAFQLSGDWR